MEAASFGARVGGIYVSGAFFYQNDLHLFSPRSNLRAICRLTRGRAQPALLPSPFWRSGPLAASARARRTLCGVTVTLQLAEAGAPAGGRCERDGFRLHEHEAVRSAVQLPGVPLHELRISVLDHVERPDDLPVHADAD